MPATSAETYRGEGFKILCIQTVNHHNHLKCQWKKKRFPRAYNCPDSFHQHSHMKDPEATAKPPSIQMPVESSLVPDPAALAINNISCSAASRISGCQSSRKRRRRKNCLMHLSKCTIAIKCYILYLCGISGFAKEQTSKMLKTHCRENVVAALVLNFYEYEHFYRRQSPHKTLG